MRAELKENDQLRRLSMREAKLWVGLTDIWQMAAHPTTVVPEASGDRDVVLRRIAEVADRAIHDTDVELLVRIVRTAVQLRGAEGRLREIRLRVLSEYVDELLRWQPWWSDESIGSLRLLRNLGYPAPVEAVKPPTKDEG